MEERIKTLARYRFETSLEALEDAKIMLQNNRFRNSLNRSYYAIFHAIRAVNSLSGFDSSKHSGVIAYFNQNYVKTGTFDRSLSRIIRSASENREKADYLDFFIASREDAETQLLYAQEFTSSINGFLKSQDIL